MTRRPRNKLMSDSTVPFSYPHDLADVLRRIWDAPLPRELDLEPLPPDETLQKILDISYHASFTAEESR
jgi:hypothetical protein